MPNTCQTCRWWDERREGDDWGGFENAHLRDLLVRDESGHPVEPQPFEVRFCGSPHLRTYERPTQDGAATVDGSQYFSALVTGPGFGCIHHARQSDITGEELD